MRKITNLKARQVFDSRGTPTIEVEVFSGNVSQKSISHSGASTGTYEAYEKRDRLNTKYFGKSVYSAVKNVNNLIKKKIIKQNVHNQEKIDLS